MKIEKSKEELLAVISKLQNEIEELKTQLNKAKADASNAIHVRSLFLSNISHEIRTPMNGIIGMYNVLRQTNLSDEQREFLDIINLSGQSLISVIDDILDLSRIESGNLKLENTKFNIVEVIKSVEQMLLIKSKGKGIDLFLEFDHNIPELVFGEETRFKQILINLTNNAIKYTKEGSVKIKTAVSKETKKNISIKFSIIDTGIGISKKSQEKLFSSFSQIDSSSTREYGGIGLGLSISKHLVNILNGTIGVESDIGKGSNFWFVLDFKKLSPDNAKSKGSDDLKKDDSKKLSILIVEDNLLNQKFAYATLIKQGHNVEIAENGLLAVEKFKKNKYDIIIMDIQMPVMDGIDAAREIRKIEKKNGVPKKEGIKILAVTAYVLERDRKMCLGAGMDEYLAKPFKPLELIKLIDKVLI